MIISSLLDTDLYKFTMQDAVRRLYPGKIARYEVMFRGHNPRMNEAFTSELRTEIDALADLELTDEEARWLDSLELFGEGFAEFLKSVRFRPAEHLSIDRADDGALRLFAEGPWAETILWETPLLALISEIYGRTVDRDWRMSPEDYYDRTRAKALEMFRQGCKVSDFGTRRRRSRALHDAMVRAMKDASAEVGREGGTGKFLGTSDVELARRHGLRPIGTMAHEWMMAHSSMRGVTEANPAAFRAWLEAHDGRHGIALADTYTHELFFRQFDTALAEAYAGVRHDSGDPVDFGETLETHYRELGIDPTTRKLIFSDGLDTDSAIDLQLRFGERFQVGFGIGTFLTNDIPGSPPLDVVMKMVEFNGRPVVKLGDGEGKASGDPRAVESAREEVRAALGG